MTKNPFDHDMTLNGGYLYTHTKGLSSRIANQTLTKYSISKLQIKDKKVIDIGCGDGIYTKTLYERCKPKLMIGTDISRNAIIYAQKKYCKKNKLEFYYHDIYSLEDKFKNFDLAIIRGVLHHIVQPERAIAKSKFLNLSSNEYMSW